MPSKNKKKSASNKLPMVSVCTPTFNRRPFIPFMFDCFRHQDYPKSRIEWIIVDDGTDKIEDLILEANIPQIKYFKCDEKMILGKKRNFMHEKCSGSIIVYMDDDDYYPPERISHAVETLRSNPDVLCVGSSALHIYFKHIKKIFQFGPYGKNHATAGTFAFRSSLLESTSYDDNAALAEEKKFLKDYSVPFAQLDPIKTILVFSHNHNTFDKKKLLINPNPKVTIETKLRVSDFVKNDNLRDFITNQIDNALSKYEAGLPKNKPDVIEQIETLTKELNERRQKEEEERKINGPILIEAPGQEPRELKNGEIRTILNEQVTKIKEQVKEIDFLKEMIQNQKQEVENAELIVKIRDKTILDLKSDIESLKNNNSQLNKSHESSLSINN
tara:strand:+ start:652 stop:1812 length:1161 start_codon:yes stop_codon:yes gene_type:complete